LAPLEALRRLGGREMAAMAGAAAEATARGAVVLVDGFVVGAALLALVHHTPAVAPRLLLAHRSAEAGHGRVLAALMASGAPVGPLLDLGLRLGEGTGALAAFSLVELACRTHAEMATFTSAAVPTATMATGTGP
jgi:nicotinate-nucleotide--dimethylbenzimidazole phosphoribosyltransferase